MFKIYEERVKLEIDTGSR